MAVTVVDAVAGTHDLRQGLLAVLPYAPDAQSQPVLARLRLFVDPDTVQIVATDRFTAGVAVVSTWEQQFPAAGVIDLVPADVQKILAVFRPPREGGGDGDSPQWQVRIELLESRKVVDNSESASSLPSEVQVLTVRVTDVSGLIPGEVLELEAVPPLESYPPIRELIASQLTAPPLPLPDRLQVAAEYLARQAKTAALYKQNKVVPPLTWLRSSSSSTAPLVVVCGHSFVGLLALMRVSDDTQTALDEVASSWCARLPGTVPTARAVDELIAQTVSMLATSDRSRHALLIDVLRVVVTTGLAAPSRLAPRFGISEREAAGLLDQLAKKDVVSQPVDDEGRPKRFARENRTVLVSPDRLEEAIAWFPPPADDDAAADSDPDREPDVDAATDSGSPSGDSDPPAGADEVTMLPAAQTLLLDAARVVITAQFGSPSMVQRVLKVPAARALRLLDALESLGVVGPHPGGSQAREVLYPVERLAEALEHIASQEGNY